jgi:gas vesicle protein
MTERVFNAGLKKLRDIQPNHPMLINIDRVGFGPVGIIYLQNALKDIHVPPPPKGTKRRDQQHIDKLRKEINKLYTSRANLSNQFIQCIDDQSRSTISDLIQDIQKDIARQIKRIDYYKEHGTKPVEKKIVEVKLPKSDFELAKMQKNKIDCLRRGKKNLEKLRKEGKSTSRQQKAIEKTQLYIDAIERKIREIGL